MMVLAEPEQRIIISKECKRLFCCFGWNIATFCSIDAEYLIHTPWNIVFFLELGMLLKTADTTATTDVICSLSGLHLWNVTKPKTSRHVHVRVHIHSATARSSIGPSLALEIEWTEWQGIVRSIAGLL